ncbi:MAG: class I SAM-dependent methyltransferase [Candidatus Bathyarchaeota archaeon]|nr:class I SAM-dependent methyltransferase [Candidatus Bathyarchaeota archaeon]
MQKASILSVYMKQHGVAKTASLIYNLTVHSNKKKLPNYQSYLPLFTERTGLEIGGPSRFFENRLPIYEVAKSVDCVNFSSETIWQGKVLEGQSYRYHKDQVGHQYICDAVDLSGIQDKKYDFCLSSNVLEHICNPLRAVEEWLRILKDDGLLLLVLPRKEFNFDHNRPVTSLEHLQSDYHNRVGEDDASHVDEVLNLHDLALDPLGGSYESFKQRCMNNYQNRAIHQHVFDLTLLHQIFNLYKLRCLESTTVRDSYVIVGRKQANQVS